jgi:uncharacterized damage-inducible protein DinB
MSRSVLEEAFAHHVWATLRLLDACLPLSGEQLATSAQGTYGSVIETMRHLVGADASYLWVLTAGKRPEIDDSTMEIAQLRAEMEANGPAWQRLLTEDRDPDETVVRHRGDGIDSHAPFGIRVAQALQHGNDHRSQICTVLTTLGIEPPEIDVWAYAAKDGRIKEVQRAS